MLNKIGCALAALSLSIPAANPASGQTLWGTDGKAVCDSPAVQETPSLIPDGMGGAVVVWADQAAGSSYDIVAQRVDAAGNRCWISGGISVCSAAYDQYTPVLTADGLGGVIIAWQDARSPLGESDVYAQRINAAGVVQWPQDGLPICAAIEYQYAPCIVPDGQGGAFVAFRDTRNDPEGGNSDIYMQRIGPNGVLLWSSDVPIATSPLQDDLDAAMISDGDGGAIIVWSDGRGFGSQPQTGQDIYVQRVTADGALAWGGDGVAVCTAGNFQRCPDIAADGAGGAIICWDDRRNGTDYNIYAQRVNASGVTQWAPNGIVVCDAANNQVTPTIQPDLSGGAIIAWTDARAGTTPSYYDIYAQRVASSGTTSWQAGGVPVCTAAGWQGRIKSSFDPSGGIFLAWSDNRVDPTNTTYNYDVYTQRLDALGSALWSENGVAACAAGGRQELHNMTNDELGRSIIVWQDSRIDPNRDIYAQKAGASSVALPVSTIKEAKDLDSGTRVSLANKIVSAVFDGFFYVQEPDRSIGLRVEATGVIEGQTITLSGKLATVDGERVLIEVSSP